MSSFFLLKRGVQIPYLFNQTQTPRSDSANLEPSEPILCPQILELRYAPKRSQSTISYPPRTPQRPTVGPLSKLVHVSFGRSLNRSTIDLHMQPWCTDSWCELSNQGLGNIQIVERPRDSVNIGIRVARFAKLGSNNDTVFHSPAQIRHQHETPVPCDRRLRTQRGWRKSARGAARASSCRPPPAPHRSGSALRRPPDPKHPSSRNHGGSQTSAQSSCCPRRRRWQ